MIWQAEEWQSGSGLWYVNCVSNLANNSGYWYHPCKILNISGDKFVQLLSEEFHINHLTYNQDKDVLIYSWDNVADARKWKNYINAAARKAGYQDT